ncbi:hypothetical protein PtrM4_056980 [Pyrenophora tritici-repentis]|uniref:Integrase catalytic domain-containing protein n=1 Tax=Pyrenophora tritici-repentis TaxID=45151 RepID=A0A834VS77_9PLEO|nr:hypothetical protein PtrM4_056980 [Pyrenophora tritici-repentis]
MPETTGNRAQEELGLDDSWAATQLQDLIKKEQKDEEFPLIADLIAEFRSYYRRTRPIASGFGTFATLEVASSGNSQGARTRSGPWITRCLDGENHKFDNCLYVNQSVRTKDWKLDKAIQDKFTELRDSPTSNSMANALRATERGLKKKTKPQAEVQSSSMISMDDGQTARDKPHVNAVLQTAAATGLLAPPLLTRWILDPGSNCHVTNTKGADWILTKKGGPSDCVYAGGALTQVEEWGETTIQVKTPTGEGQMKLTWVAYIPGFFTSVVGLSRSRSLGINFDSGRDCLYQKKASNFGAVVVVVKLDNERGYSELLYVLKDLGIIIEPRAEYTEEQNGLSEQAGKMIVIRARAIRIDGLPMELSNECCLVAVYLLNRTPIESLGWKTPYEVVREQKPSAAHLNVVGARAYVLNNKLKRGEKLESRALMGQLVGYDSTNIYRVWMPALGRVLRTRDVVFMSNDGTELVYPDRQTLREVVTILDVPEPLEETDQEIEALLQSAQRDWSVEMPRGWETIPAEAEAPDR